MIAVRPACLEDARPIARIEVETWRSTYAGMVPDRVLTGMSEGRQTSCWNNFLRQRPGDVLVAEDPGGRILGFGNCGRQRDRAIDFAGEVYTLYVRPEEQGAGIGRQLLDGLFHRLVACGHGSAVIWVVRANPSRFFYERLGGRLASHRAIPVGGQPVEALAYGWRDLAAALDRRVRSGGRFDPPHGSAGR
jgi:ribosomal protein S18 acetylase RimI-like enzyme